MTLTVTNTSTNSVLGTAADALGAAVSGAVGAQKNGGDVFGSLLAALFSLTGAALTEGLPGDKATTALTAATNNIAANNNITTETIAATTKELLEGAGITSQQLSKLDLPALLKATLEGATVESDGAEVVATPQQLINSLITALEQFEGTVETSRLTQASNVVDAIIKALPEDGKLASLSNPAQVEALTKLAEKFSLQSPELSAKLTQLTEKLQQVAPPAPATADDAELQKTLQALFGEKQLTGKAANTPVTNSTPAGAAKGIDQSGAQNNSPIDTTKLDFNPTRTLAQTGEQASKQVPTQSTAIAGAAATPNASLAKTDAAPQTDALLLAQSGNQLGIKTDIAAAVKPATAAYQTPTQNLNLPHIAFEIASQHKAGMSRFQIRLDPPEMGRIDVRMNVDATGNLNARLIVERADTLDMLQRDSRALERALQQAGIEGSRTNLEFSLKQNPFARQDGQPNGQGQAHAEFNLDDAHTITNDDIPLSDPIYYRGTAGPGGLNLIA